jgi:hypothetical protein
VVSSAKSRSHRLFLAVWIKGVRYRKDATTSIDVSPSFLDDSVDSHHPWRMFLRIGSLVTRSSKTLECLRVF